MEQKETIQKEYSELQKKFEAHEKETRKKIKAVIQKLKYQNDKVVQPLIQELKISSEIQIRAKKDLDNNIEDLKALSAILRLPALTD